MKIFSSILLLTFCFAVTINAQNKMNFGVRGIVALPMGSFGDVAGTGYGAQGIYEIKFGNNLVGVGQVGYITWSEGDVAGISYGYSAVPVNVGIKYYVTPGKGFYATSSVGFHFFSFDSDLPTFTFGGTSIGGSVSATSTDFAFNFGLGYEIPVSKNASVDIGGAYNLISDANYVSVHLGAKLGL